IVSSHARDSVKNSGLKRNVCRGYARCRCSVVPGGMVDFKTTTFGSFNKCTAFFKIERSQAPVSLRRGVGTHIKIMEAAFTSSAHPFVGFVSNKKSSLPRWYFCSSKK